MTGGVSWTAKLRAVLVAISLVASSANKLASASAPLWTLDQEIFEEERTLTAMQRATAGEARDFAICSRSGRCFNPDDLVVSRAVRTLKLCRPVHRQRIGSGAVDKEVANEAIRPNEKTLLYSTYARKMRFCRERI